MTPQELIAFEEDIAAEYNAGNIRAPVHLYSGCEEQMIAAFRMIGADDWVFCSWRAHYQCLLKGVPPDVLKKEIMDGHSISLCFPEHRILSSAIVGGILPIALGTAWAIKHRGGTERVFAWMGDMTALTGIAQECMLYASQHDLPIMFILEDNGISVCTDTRDTWGLKDSPVLHVQLSSHIYQYSYQPKYPHAGAGQRINF